MSVPLHSRLERKNLFKIFLKKFGGKKKGFYLCSRFERKVVKNKN